MRKLAGIDSCSKTHAVETSFFPTETTRQSIHLAEGLTVEDKRLFLGARLRLLYRKLSRNSPITREELAALAAYASDAADEGGVSA
jgi:hypothetical protein